MTAESSPVATSTVRVRLRPPRDTVPGDTPPVVETPATTETWSEKLFGALPLWIVGGICLAIAIDLYSMGTTTMLGVNGSARLYPWALFFALAVTGLAAGTFAMLLEEEPPAPTPATAVAPGPAAETPEWDESTILPEPPEYVRPRTWERYPGTPVDTGFESVSPDVVLSQIDEIEESLRKKPRRSDSD